MNRGLAISLVSIFAISVLAPFASATGMQACTLNGGTCDTWDKADDGTENQQDWIVGIYEFDLVDTSTINMEMSWALHEFNRTTLGLDGALLNAALAAEGMSPQDGAPADLIRNYFDQTTAGPGTPTVRDKLILEVNDTIEELLSGGFGSVNSISTDYVNSISNSGITTTCTDDPSMDSASEAGLSDNVFDPPICFSVTASVTLSTSTFNLGSVDPLTLERVYRGMLVMGSDITSNFDLFSEPGHNSVFVINPPDFATVKSVDSEGTRVIKQGPPSYMAAQWEIDNLDAPIGGERLTQTASVEIGHRNSTQTSSVEIGPEDTGITLHVTLDLSNEDSAWVDIVAGINHIDDATMSDWGISLVDVTENAQIPWVTSDGIRLAYQSDLVDLDNFTNNFPMNLVGDAIESAVPGVGDVTIGNPSWVSQSLPVGIPEPAGGLNFTHVSCPETLPPGTQVYYCVEGPNAMDGSHPIYLRASSNTFELRMLDLLKQEVDDSTGLLDVIQESDLQRILDSGLTIETEFGQDLLQDMIPNDLPPSELTLELILPQWLQTSTGDGSIVLVERSNGVDDLAISIGDPNSYDPRHAILDSDGEEICSADEADWSCIDLDVELDVSDLNFNEWGPSIDLTASFSATVDVYRIKIPDEVLDELKSDDTSVSLEVIPSDLIRLGLDIGGRLAEPITNDVNLSGDEDFNFEFTTEGLEALVEQMGIELTNRLHKSALEASNREDAVEIDLSGIQIITSLENLGGIGTSIGDETPIRLSVKIPEFTFEAGVTNGWNGIIDGEPTVGVVTALQSPLINAVNSFQNLLTNVGLASLQMSGSGLDIDNNGEPFEFSLEPLENDDSFSYRLLEHYAQPTEIGPSDLRGEVTFLMPDGITLENFQTANGWEKVDEVDGRQRITLSLESLAAGEEITFSVKVSWWYVLSQIWIYPTIILSLIVWRVRARRKKKKRKRELAAAAETKIVSAGSGKGGLSDSDFAALSAGYDPTAKSSGGFDLYADDQDLSMYDDEPWN
tara:strand:- start:16142 stop:19186 length:3045 start_codon:yes stop_codon:yes gene_type:complete